MALTDAYVQGYGKLPELFAKIRDAQAPDQLTYQLLKDWGFTSSSDRMFPPLLKALGFLSPDGKPTSRYHAYRDHSRSASILGEAIREAYNDIFLIKAQPMKEDSKAVEGKFKSFHNANDRTAKAMTSTFFALLNLADLNGQPPMPLEDDPEAKQKDSLEPKPNGIGAVGTIHTHRAPSLHYNIQIHLPATKDVAVYNAIFKALKDHLFEI